MADLIWNLTQQQLEAILEYTVHRPDCKLVTHRHDPKAGCTCKLANALASLYPEQIRHQQAHDLPPDQRPIRNATIFGGRSLPQWLLELVPAKRVVIRDTMNMPGPMSDG